MTELPSGAVTFLFSDIEGSTRLVKQLRGRWGEVLREHQSLLRIAFVAHGGHEVDTQGDSFFVAFDSAREAVLAALEGQLALLAHTWPDGVQVRVRMGIHTGQATVTDGRYTGLAVHRAARIGAAGHGGQVLVSQATQTLLEDEEEDLHVSLRNLGEQRLKDLDRPVRLYQIEADGLPSEFPRIRHEAELTQAGQAAISVPLWRRPRLLAAALLAAAAALTSAIVLALSGGSTSITVKPNSVAIIDPNGNKIVAQITVGARPGPIAGGNGSVWVGNLDDRNLSRIDAAGRTVKRTISLDNRTPTGITTGSGGVWVAHGLLGSLSRVDPRFDSVTSIGNVAGRGRGGAVAVGGGSVWAAYGDSTVVRVATSGNRVTGRTFAGSFPAGIAFGAEAVWVAHTEPTVYRFNPATFTSGPVARPSVAGQSTAITYGAGALWVTSGRRNVVSRIDPADNSVITIPVGPRPSAVAAGPAAVWVANSGDGTVSRIEPTTNKVVATIHVGNYPAGIALAKGLVWVTVQQT